MDFLPLSFFLSLSLSLSFSRVRCGSSPDRDFRCHNRRISTDHPARSSGTTCGACWYIYPAATISAVNGESEDKRKRCIINKAMVLKEVLASIWLINFLTYDLDFIAHPSTLILSHIRTFATARLRIQIGAHIYSLISYNMISIQTKDSSSKIA